MTQLMKAPRMTEEQFEKSRLKRHRLILDQNRREAGCDFCRGGRDPSTYMRLLSRLSTYTSEWVSYPPAHEKAKEAKEAIVKFAFVIGQLFKGEYKR